MSEKQQSSSSGSGATVKLDFADWRYEEWTFTVGDKEYTIKKGGTEVPASVEDDLKKAASAERESVKLRKVG